MSPREAAQRTQALQDFAGVPESEVAALSRSDQAIVDLRRQGRFCHEIARAVGYTPQAIDYRLRRIRRQLRRMRMLSRSGSEGLPGPLATVSRESGRPALGGTASRTSTSSSAELDGTSLVLCDETNQTAHSSVIESSP